VIAVPDDSAGLPPGTTIIAIGTIDQLSGLEHLARPGPT